MSVTAIRTLLALVLAIGAAACAEEKADADLVKNLSPSSAADGGAKAGDAGSGPRGVDGGVSFAPFDNAVDKFIETYNKSDAGMALPIKGASAIVVDKGGLLHQQGYGDYEADRLYLIASASKILSVGVLMRLADQGKLDMDEPISTYFGEEWGADAKAGAVTAAQLVSNSSGLPSLAEVSAAARDLTSPLATNLCQYNPTGTLKDCAKILYETDPPREPDTTFAYGGSQWQLAGALAEQVSGKSWAELIDETYKKPCDVKSLGYTNQFAKASLGYPTFFMADEANLDVTDNPSIEGGAYITAPDYAKILQMHLNNGMCGKNRVLSEKAVKRMQEDRVGEYGGNLMSPAFTGYGLGWWINDAEQYVADPGAYGAFPWIDQKRNHAAMVIIETSSTVGAQLVLTAAKPALDGLLDKKPAK
jgi:CubicO group peptidase (beta-lactamase class C family)